MALSRAVLGTEIAFNIFPFLGLQNLLSIYCLLNNNCLEKFKLYLMTHKDIHNGVLDRTNAEIVTYVIDLAIYAIFQQNLGGCSVEAAKVIKASGIWGLRQNNNLPSIYLNYMLRCIAIGNQQA